jgi:hypothetical protein
MNIMKKILFTLVALMSIMTVQAQSICASWRSVEPVVETDEDGSLMIQNLLYTFNEDGSYTLVDEFTLSSEPAPTMAIEIATSISIKGTYTLEGDKLSMTPNMDTYKFELLSISQNGQVTSNPMVKAQVKSMFNSAEFKEQFAAAEECTVKVGDSMLEMNDGEKTYNYTRFATVQN